MTTISCTATDMAGQRCGLQEGHPGQHMMGAAAAPKTSFARIVVTPVLVLVAGFLGGLAVGPMLVWLLGAAVIGIIYILVASRH